jgi:hypothetical protein
MAWRRGSLSACLPSWRPAHVVLTLLYYTGVDDSGVGYIFGWEWRAWIITIVDATVAWLLWFAYRPGTEKPSLGLIAKIAAAIMALGQSGMDGLRGDSARRRYRRVCPPYHEKSASTAPNITAMTRFRPAS